jgi:hypothetical protein
MYPFMRLRSGGHDTVPATRMMRLGLTTVSSVLRLAAMAFCTAFHACMFLHGFIEPPVRMAAQVWHGAGAHAHGELGTGEGCHVAHAVAVVGVGKAVEGGQDVVILGTLAIGARA